MTAALNRLATRIDALSLRERVILFLSLAVVLLGVADQTVISGSLREQQSWNSQMTRDAAALAALRAELTQLSQGSTPPVDRAAPPAVPMSNPAPPAPAGAAVSAAPQLLRDLGLLAAERQRLLDRLQRNDSDAAEAVDPTELPELLARVLQRHGQVSLVRLTTQAITPDPVAPTQTQGTAWRGASLSLSGSYGALQAFIAELELKLPGLRWGTLQLAIEDGSPLLTVQLWLSEGSR